MIVLEFRTAIEDLTIVHSIIISRKAFFPDQEKCFSAYINQRKFYLGYENTIACDMEGITGVTRWSIVTVPILNIHDLKLMTEDVTQWPRAFSAGVDEIFVGDGHNRGQNLLIENLIIIAYNGTFSWSMMNGIDQQIDAVMLIDIMPKPEL